MNLTAMMGLGAFMGMALRMLWLISCYCFSFTWERSVNGVGTYKAYAPVPIVREITLKGTFVGSGAIWD
jgi:hypothetical protein